MHRNPPKKFSLSVRAAGLLCSLMTACGGEEASFDVDGTQQAIIDGREEAAFPYVGQFNSTGLPVGQCSGSLIRLIGFSRLPIAADRLVSGSASVSPMQRSTRWLVALPCLFRMNGA